MLRALANRNIVILTMAMCLVALPEAGMSHNLNFYIVAKSQSDMNFQRVLEGCNAEASRYEDKCFLAGPEKQAQPREQFFALSAIQKLNNADGIAISVINSRLVSSLLKESTVPTITFDSPLLTKAVNSKQLLHIGVDDLEVGRKLAQLVAGDYPQGGNLCIMTDADPNLAARVKGIRLELSQGKTSDKLTGQNGWTESKRCPWLTADNAERVAKELTYTIDTIQPDAILSVGHWPVYFPAITNEISHSYLSRLSSGQPYLYSAIGNMLPYYPDLMAEGYVQGLVEIDFFKQGRLIYHTLKALSEGKDGTMFTTDQQLIVTHHR